MKWKWERTFSGGKHVWKRAFAYFPRYIRDENVMVWWEPYYWRIEPGMVNWKEYQTQEKRAKELFQVEQRANEVDIPRVA